jgi:hypothetical protein
VEEPVSTPGTELDKNEQRVIFWTSMAKVTLHRDNISDFLGVTEMKI